MISLPEISLKNYNTNPKWRLDVFGVMWKENNDLMRFQISPALFGRDLKNVSHKQVEFGERVKKEKKVRKNDFVCLSFPSVSFDFLPGS